jgi:uncharacterized protein
MHDNSQTIRSPGLVRNKPVDALRGLALMGIVWVNAAHFAAPWGYVGMDNTADKIAVWLTLIFGAGNFFPVFAFLFGVGIAVAASREAGTSRHCPSRMQRRLWMLAMIGFAHSILLFFGDILLLYALCGALVWRLRAQSSIRLLRLSCKALVAGFIGFWFVLVSGAFLGEWPKVIPGEGYLGSFFDAVILRVEGLPMIWLEGLVGMGGITLGAMLAGFVVARRGLFPVAPCQPKAFAPDSEVVIWLRRWFFLTPARAFFIGVVASGLGVAFLFSEHSLELYAIGSILWPAGALLLAYGWAGIALCWLMRHPDAKITHLFAAVGASSLSGYLLHSVLFGALFYGWGAGYYGAVGGLFTLCAALGVGITLLIVLNIWQRLFGVGPCERLFRTSIMAERRKRLV